MGIKKVVGFGELMLRLAPEGYLRWMQANRFDVFYTGAESNVCASLSQFGVETEFVTKLPDNGIAKCAVASLKKFGIGTQHIVFGGDRMGIFYLEKGASQRPSRVVYDRKFTSIATASRSDFDWDSIMKDAQFFHFTGITPALSEGMPAICEDACKAAKEHGVTVSCDLNYRKNLWTTAQAKTVMENLLRYVDILIANEEDAEKVLGIKAADTDIVAGKLNYEGYREVAKQISEKFDINKIGITLRESISASDNEWAAMLYTDGKAYFSKKYRVHIVDRVGAGDSFAAGLLYGIGNGFDTQKTVEFAAAASCLKHSIEMDYNLSDVGEVERLMSGDGSGRVQR